jgi:hypothetical protein
MGVQLEYKIEFLSGESYLVDAHKLLPHFKITQNVHSDKDFWQLKKHDVSKHTVGDMVHCACEAKSPLVGVRLFLAVVGNPNLQSQIRQWQDFSVERGVPLVVVQL